MNDTQPTQPSLWQRFWDSGAWGPALFLAILLGWLAYLKWAK